MTINFETAQILIQNGEESVLVGKFKGKVRFKILKETMGSSHKTLIMPMDLKYLIFWLQSLTSCTILSFFRSWMFKNERHAHTQIRCFICTCMCIVV